MNTIRCIVLAAIFCALCGGLAASCAAERPMSVSDFRFRCRFAEDDRLLYNDDIAGCDLQMQARLCDEYTDNLRMQHPNSASCIQGCRNVVARNNAMLNFSSCFHFATRSRDICEQYCRQHFP